MNVLFIWTNIVQENNTVKLSLENLELYADVFFKKLYANKETKLLFLLHTSTALSIRIHEEWMLAIE